MSYLLFNVLTLLDVAKFIFNPITKQHDVAGEENRLLPRLERGMKIPEVLK